MTISGGGLSARDITDNLFGRRVSRASANLPQSTAEAVFNVVGGRVLIRLLSAEITEVIETKTNNMKVKANATVSGIEDLCTTRNISGDPVGNIYSLTGPASDTLNAKAAPIENPTLIVPGTIEVDCSASSTGKLKWDIWYIPLDAGARITVA